MSDLSNELESGVKQIIAKYQGLFLDGSVSFTELFSFVTNAIGTLVQIGEKLDGISGAEKKAAVLTALGTLFDQVIAPLDIKGVPNFLEGVVDSALRELILSLASSTVDSLVNIFNKTGWGTTPAVPTEGFAAGELLTY